MATAASWRAAGQILQARREREPLVVVSAVGSVPGRAKVTDLLLQMVQQGQGIEALKTIHDDLLATLKLPKKLLDPLWQELSQLVSAPHHPGPAFLDQVMGFGERLCAQMMAAFLCQLGWNARAAEPAELCLVSDARFQDASILDSSLDKIAQAVFRSKECLVVPGFVGVTKQGQPTTLGRGGSDYTAAIIGAALKREVEIWTDVSGVASCNPGYLPADLRRLGHPRVIPQLSHEEAYQMAAFGSKVLYQKCLDAAQMASRKGRHLQLIVRNTFDHEGHFTLLAGHRELAGKPKGITALEGVQLLTVYLDRHQELQPLQARIAELTQATGVKVLMSSLSSGRVSFVFDRLVEELEALEKDLNEAHLSRDQVLIKVVGDALGENHAVIAKIHGALERVTVREQHPAVHKSPQFLTDSTYEMVAYKRTFRAVILELYRQLFMANQVHVGLLGLGTVGGGVIDYCRQLYSHHKTGIELFFPIAAVRDSKRPRKYADLQLTEDANQVLEDVRVEVVAEMMGGLEPARSHLLAALRKGMQVVTANKAVVAHFGPELFATEQKWGGHLAFEASVCGEIPVLEVVENLPSDNDVQGIRAIMNGTSNFILTLMEEGRGYPEALGLAQELGFAEADPTLDVSGADAAQKLAILSSLVFHRWVEWNQIPLCGIDKLIAADFENARRLGLYIRSVAYAHMTDKGLELWVSPAMVPASHPLASVRRETNAVALNLFGRPDPLTLVGKGAGSIPTARSVVRDLAQLANRLRSAEGGRSKPRPTQPLKNLLDPGAQQHRWWVRLKVQDQTGVFAHIAKSFGSAGLSICEAAQELTNEVHADGNMDGECCALIFLTTRISARKQLDKALKSIQQEPWLLDLLACPML